MHKKETVTAAIIGFGKMGQQHAKAILQLQNSQLVGIVESNPLLENTLDHLGIEIPIYRSLDELYANSTPDIVHVVTPPTTHKPLANQALEFGSNVYIEKPFTLDSIGAEQLIQLAETKGLMVCAGHQNLFEVPFLKLVEELPKIGNIRHVESYFSFRTVRKNINPVDQILDILPHALYLLIQPLCALNGEESEFTIEGISAAGADHFSAVLQSGSSTGLLTVTLRGRPVENYLKVVGDNGAITADFVTGSVITLPGPGSTIFSILPRPYRIARQTIFTSTHHFYKRIISRGVSYPGLVELIARFHKAVINQAPMPVSPSSIRSTVRLFEQIRSALETEQARQEEVASNRLKTLESNLPSIDASRKRVLVTGATGKLGSRVAEKLRSDGSQVVGTCRSMPPASMKVAGINYVMVDLSKALDAALLDEIDCVVHCAAETQGGFPEHQENTINATRLLLEACIQAGLREFIHISSIAVLKADSSVPRPLNESSAVDFDNKGRGAYVWGKAEAEKLIQEFGGSKINCKILRPGPLVDYNDFVPPGRLGREIYRRFVIPGRLSDTLDVCDVATAAELIAMCVHQPESIPDVVNLLDTPPPSRGQLAEKVLKSRPDLRRLSVPMWIISGLSSIAIFAQRLFLRSAQPINIASAFRSEEYDSTLVQRLLEDTNA